jgi:hypothetical protein
MTTHRQLWRELNSRTFYTRFDLVLDCLTAILIAVGLTTGLLAWFDIL